MEKELPIGWVETELHVVAEILDNLRKPVNSTERSGRIGNIPYYGATGQAGWIDDYLFDEELVLVGEDGAPFFDKTKNVAYLINGKTWVNNHAHVLKAISKISSNKFLLHFLNQFDYKDFVGGTTRLKLTQGDLKIIPVPLPPLPEQQRIVAKLDTLFGHLDRIKTGMDRIPQLLKDFRQKVLTQAVTGKLTEEWREGRAMEECDLDCFCESSFYGPRFSSEEYSPKGYPTVRTTDMTDNGFILIGQNTPRIIIQDEKKLELYKIKTGDLLITRTGSIGKMARYDGEEIAIPSAYLIRFRFNEKALTDFIYYCLTSPYGQNQMGLSSTAITQPNLNAQKIKALKVPNISIEEQQEIVRRVESLFAKADQIEASYQKLKAKIEQLPQALLAKAFRGELVVQLPTDGDARDLLEEIKRAKEGLEKGGKGKKYREDETELRMVADGKRRYGKR